MFLCHWHKYRVKGHEGAGPRSLRTVARAFLHKEFLMVLHHLCMVLVCFPISALWRQGKGDFFLGCMLMAELSTPFVCLGKVLILVSTRWGRGGEAGRLGSLPSPGGKVVPGRLGPSPLSLPQYKQQHTLLHKVNGLLMLLTFFCCRILLFPYMYWAYGRHAGLPLHRVPLALPPAYNLGAALLLAPQLYWFGLICRGAFRLFRRARPKDTAALRNGHGPGGRALD
ncbi:sodium:proton antiporter [Platysternon megacephalum]|uniref:Sodium:proton antiporter n=1 Tax=Platysternon megacephalum TaxID=55544 RepID=A0A4D9DMG2_9SAUR|nr:sodium:proton antiporter [Platysternon megacephalum]